MKLNLYYAIVYVLSYEKPSNADKLHNIILKGISIWVEYCSSRGKWITGEFIIAL